jgi:hypothetical protein
MGKHSIRADYCLGMRLTLIACSDSRFSSLRPPRTLTDSYCSHIPAKRSTGFTAMNMWLAWAECRNIFVRRTRSASPPRPTYVWLLLARRRTNPAPERVHVRAESLSPGLVPACVMCYSSQKTSSICSTAGKRDHIPSSSLTSSLLSYPASFQRAKSRVGCRPNLHLVPLYITARNRSNSGTTERLYIRPNTPYMNIHESCIQRLQTACRRYLISVNAPNNRSEVPRAGITLVYPTHLWDCFSTCLCSNLMHKR